MGDMMSEFGHNEIIYEEGWRENTPVGGDEPPADETPVDAAPSAVMSKPLLISIQLILCVIAVIVLFILKAMDSPAYHNFMTWYKVEMNRPVISQEFFRTFDVSRLAGGEVTVKASADELPPR